ncbi:ABC transporter substrate-binding protein [Clostridium oryzae]|uniref:Multiple sugar-binding protein n=1 Tax=Clostridium oryzae TaxID=1450648 RepID=A0A1V4III6_9CLOT|nr:extracellular solute-binding protein [Clostridium oryzae]OPJ59505.1 multiple sugar-binding protein precursor [Clostridium oryzae]
MKKKSLGVIAAIASLSIASSILVGCGKKTTNNTKQTTNNKKSVTITCFQNSPEYTDAINAYIDQYKKVKPNVKIDLEITQADYPTLLKAKIASNNIPDVFSSTAGGEIKSYAEYSADLSNEPLAKAMTDAVRTNMSYNGKVLGLPLKANVFALIYNKDLFEKAGITKPPTTVSELEAACKKLQSAGITPFTNGYKEWWVFKHIFQHYMDADTPDVSKLVDKFIAGKTKFEDHPLLYDNFFDFIDLSLKYGTAKPLESDYNAEVSAFASEKVAMMTGQGAWAEEGILKINPNIKIGIIGYPVSNNPKQSQIIAGADQALRIYNKSKVLNETKALFNWLYTSDYGKSWFSETAKVIPPIKDAKMPNLQIPKAMQQITKTQKVGDVAINYSLDSFHQKFGEIMQAYISKAKTRDQAVREIEKAWMQLGAAK